MKKDEIKDADPIDTTAANDTAVDSAEVKADAAGNGTPLKRGYNVSDGGLIFSLVIVAYLLINIIAIIFSQSKEGEPSVSFAMTLTITAIVELSMLFIWFMYGRNRKIDYMKCSRVNRDMSMTKLVKTLAVIVALFGFAILIEYFLKWFCKVIGYKLEMAIEKEWQLFVMMPVITILPAICEEFIFRGVILPSLESKGKWKAILISAALFALMHMNFGQTVYQFLLGVVLGYLVVTFRTIWVGVIGHLVSNGLAMLKTIAAGYGFGLIMEIILFVLAGICLIAVVTYVVLRMKSPQNSRPPDLHSREETDTLGEQSCPESPDGKSGVTEPVSAPVVSDGIKEEKAADAVAPKDRTKGREAVFLSYFAGIGVSLIIWIVDFVTQVS